MGSERVRKRPDVLASPAGMSCELATEGVRARWIGVAPGQQCGPHGSWRWPVSCAAKADLALTCRSSVGVAPARVVTLPVALSEWGLHLVGHNATGFEAICCCARGSNWSQKSTAALGGASRKRATQGTPTMEGALDRGSAPPLTRRRAEAVLVLPQGSATEGVRGQGHGLCPGRKRRDEGASRGGLEITSSQVRASLVPRETGDNRAPAPKLWARRQARPRSIMLSAKVSTGRAAWKPPSPAKADGGGDSRAGRSVECSCQRSVAEVG